MKTVKHIQQQINMKEFFKYIAGYFADLGMLVLAFLAPIHVILWTIISVVVIDTITGIMKAGKKDVKDIKSRKAATIVSKLIFYVSGVIIAQIFQNTIDPDIPFVKLIASAIILIEVKSIDENMKSTLGWSFFDRILDAVKRKTEPVISKSEDKVDNEENVN